MLKLLATIKRTRSETLWTSRSSTATLLAKQPQCCKRGLTFRGEERFRPRPLASMPWEYRMIALAKTKARADRDALRHWVERVASFFHDRYGLPPITGRIL